MVSSVCAARAGKWRQRLASAATTYCCGGHEAGKTGRSGSDEEKPWT